MLSCARASALWRRRDTRGGFRNRGGSPKGAETAKKAKKRPTETAYTDDQGLQAFRKVDGTAIGTPINFRTALGHGVPRISINVPTLTRHKPILDDFLQALAFAPI